MECKEKKGLKVLPVFYKVEPREVRGQKQSYGKAMGEHEVKFGKNSEQVKRWKKALYDAGGLSGWPYTDGYEVGLIQHIVHEISTQLGRTPLYVAKDLVGIDSRVQELKTILNLQSEGDVLMVGLWGQGGVGKTTLAEAIHNTIFRDFQGASFLERVRENFINSNDLVPLQKKLLSQLLQGKELTIYNVGGGRQLIKQRLCSKKVLIILDDVDNACQLNALAKEREWFGEGSRIIITTRDKHLLTSHGINPYHIYEVKALKEGEALELLRKHAFRGNQEIEISSNLVHQVLHYARGLPLALQVLGAFLCGRGEDEWESTLQKLAETPDGEINAVLKVSYDGLELYAKEIFLHIACFFRGRSTEYIKKVLDSCDFHTTIGIKVLIERCLISEEVGKIQMHDLIQLMGMDIVKDEDRDYPINRSRLWLRDDVLDVLSEDKETKAIKAIVLQLPKPEDIYIGPDAFTKMKSLKLLILFNVNNSIQGPIHLHNGLRWFEWPNCGSTLEFSHGQKKLVGLDMRNSKIKGTPRHFKDLQNLKFINFSSCRSLVCTPNLDGTPNLKKLDLSWCTNLEHVHESVAYHGNLQFLNLHSCYELHHFPDVLRTKNLLFLNLDCCSKLQRFPDIPDKIKGLHSLSLAETSIEELPASIENFVSLKDINLTNCQKLANLPPSIYKLENLEILNLSKCSKLMKFPKEEEDSSDPHAKTGFPQLLSLILVGCNLSDVEFLENPSCFPHLNTLYVSECHQLKEILKIPRKLHNLIARDCKSLSKIPSDIHHVQNVYLPLCHELVNNGLTMNDLVNLEHLNPKGKFLLPGGEMPRWLLPKKEGYLSFTTSKDLYKQIVALVVSVVFRKGHTEVDHFYLETFVNGKEMILSNFHEYGYHSPTSCLDHVWLQHWEPCQLWGGLEDAFGANDRSQFHVKITARRTGAIVTKCGFRLICKPLEEDLEILLKDDQLLDPALVYEIQNEDCQTSLEEAYFAKPGLAIKDVFTIERCRYSLLPFYYQRVSPGGEIPEEFILVEDGTISFMASQDLYYKFVGLALCVVVSVEGGEKEISFDIVPHIHGQRWNGLSGTLGSFDSDQVWIQCLEPNVLWGVLEGEVDFGQFNERYLRFSIELSLSGGTVKKLGYVLKCTPLEDNLKAIFADNPLMDPAALWEDGDEVRLSDTTVDSFVFRLSQHRKRERERESKPMRVKRI